MMQVPYHCANKILSGLAVFGLYWWWEISVSEDIQFLTPLSIYVNNINHNKIPFMFYVIQLLWLGPAEKMHTCIVVVEFDVSVFMSSNTNWKSWMADDSVYLTGGTDC